MPLTKFGKMTHEGEQRVSRRSATLPSQGTGVSASAKLFETYMRAHSMIINNQLLHGDQTTRSTTNADARSVCGS